MLEGLLPKKSDVPGIGRRNQSVASIFPKTREKHRPTAFLPSRGRERKKMSAHLLERKRSHGNSEKYSQMSMRGSETTTGKSKDVWYPHPQFQSED